MTTALPKPAPTPIPAFTSVLRPSSLPSVVELGDGCATTEVSVRPLDEEDGEEIAEVSEEIVRESDDVGDGLSDEVCWSLESGRTTLSGFVVLH